MKTSTTYYYQFIWFLKTFYFVLGLLFSHWIMSDPFVTPRTAACQVPLSMGSARQEYWSGLPFPSPGDLPDLGIGPVSPALAGRLSVEPAGKPLYWCIYVWDTGVCSIISDSFIRNSHMERVPRAKWLGSGWQGASMLSTHMTGSWLTDGFTKSDLSESWALRVSIEFSYVDNWRRTQSPAPPSSLEAGNWAESSAWSPGDQIPTLKPSRGLETVASLQHKMLLSLIEVVWLDSPTYKHWLNGYGFEQTPRGSGGLEPGVPQSMGSQRVGNDSATKNNITGITQSPRALGNIC